MDPVRLMFARFPGGGMDRAEVTDWLVASVLAAKAEPRIQEDIFNWRITDTPITMGRNRCIEIALQKGIDFLVMVDNDMAPDYYWGGNPHCFEPIPETKDFFTSSFDFLWDRREKGKPAGTVAVPYCGPPPHENIYVFQWANLESHTPEDSSGGMRISQYTREQAATMSGIVEAAALPTGLIMIDMKAVAKTDPPYFYYEWKDFTESEKASTEDVTFTRDMSLNGAPQFCNWDAWAGHYKWKCVGRPYLLSPDSVSARLANRVLAKHNIKNENESFLFVGKEGVKQDEREQDNGSPEVPAPALASLTPDRASSPSVQ